MNLPIGAAYYLDPEDFLPDDDMEDGESPNEYSTAKLKHDELLKSATEIYNQFSSKWGHKLDWINPDYFTAKLKKDLVSDCETLIFVLNQTSNWDPAKDKQLQTLYNLITKTHPDEKLLIFTEYADTAKYVYNYLSSMSINKLAVVWGNSDDPTSVAHRFSPISNGKQSGKENELRVLVSTDVLSEGQNLQDSHIIINYDLPWAIIGLIQRAGRVDRIGQESPEILVYSFLPDKKVENVIKVIEKLKRRIRQSTQVLGGDESFFEDQELNLDTVYGENSDLLESGQDDDGEIDLTSYAYQIWKNATDANTSPRRLFRPYPILSFLQKRTIRCCILKESFFIQKLPPMLMCLPGLTVRVKPPPHPILEFCVLLLAMLKLHPLINSQTITKLF
ncbi:MAG: SWF/SNF helicase family protein [Ignavibacteriales bacterium]|nr:SWF/SNF helicase family protein [Ignavibacteriales bacterium]